MSRPLTLGAQTSVLQKKFSHGMLPSAWILRTRGGPEELRAVVEKVFNINLPVEKFQHPDFCYLAPETEKKNGMKDYKVEDIAALFSFSSFAPLQWKQKIVIFDLAQLFGAVVSNKLLKILEDPPPFLSLGMLVPSGHTLAPTIEGRALSFYHACDLGLNWAPEKINQSKGWPEHFASFIAFAPESRPVLETLWKWAGKKISTSQGIQALSEEDSTLALAFLRGLSCLYPTHYQLLDEQLKLENIWERSSDYHNAAHERSFLLLCHWKRWVEFFPVGPLSN